jgi:hypothetical protein
MTTEETWDPDQHPLPAWKHSVVAAILAGLEWRSGDSITLRHKRTDVIYSFHGVRFSCGCVADDYFGWRPCKSRLHNLLAAQNPESPTVLRYRSLRTAFDAVLAEAWRRRAQESTAYAEFYDDRARKPFLRFEAW